MRCTASLKRRPIRLCSMLRFELEINVEVDDAAAVLGRQEAPVIVEVAERAVDVFDVDPSLGISVTFEVKRSRKTLKAMTGRPRRRRPRGG
jgi:hypothetical protein